MALLNIEIKARTRRAAAIRHLLKQQQADFRGVDQQRDTYFHCPRGRLKLRQGKIENNLIHYHRPDQHGPKASVVSLYPAGDGEALRKVLEAALGIWKVVNKKREIYFIGNVKFHLDEVEGLGSFVEIEAIDEDGSIGEDQLRRQCETYMALFGIEQYDLLDRSYSDMLE